MAGGTNGNEMPGILKCDVCESPLDSHCMNEECEWMMCVNNHEVRMRDGHISGTPYQQPRSNP